MSHIAHPKISIRPRPGARTSGAAAPAAPLAAAPTSRASLAAPLVLAAVVVGDLGLALTFAVVGAVGG